MKKLSFILAVSLFSLASCKNKDDKGLVGKWKPVEMNIAGMTAEDKKEFLSSAVIEFTKDGKFSATRTGTRHTGTYEFNEKDNSLSTRDAGEESVQKYTVSWEGDQLVMTNEDGNVKLKRQ